MLEKTKCWLKNKNNFKNVGLVRDLNPGPLAPKARIIPLDQRAVRNCDIYMNVLKVFSDKLLLCTWNFSLLETHL